MCAVWVSYAALWASTLTLTAPALEVLGLTIRDGSAATARAARSVSRASSSSRRSRPDRVIPSASAARAMASASAVDTFADTTCRGAP